MAENITALELGSNIDPVQNMDKAIAILQEETDLLSVSGYIQTAPVGFTDQDDFINAAVLIRTNHDIQSMREYCRDIENRLGRVRTENRYGPRTMDLDIITWNGEVVNNDYHTRDFVRQTVNEVLSFIKNL
jgi:2-amino-4-hydroxy-6-hydroxymethyldihydropteridine diphosphokinase